MTGAQFENLGISSPWFKTAAPAMSQERCVIHIWLAFFKYSSHVHSADGNLPL
jgi:hypothetical protein